MGLAIAPPPTQVGGALGVAGLGSVLSSSYASHIAGSLHGAARNVAAGAGDSVGSTVTALASGRFGPGAVTVLEAARMALVQAMGSAVTIAVGVALLGTLTALIFLPTRPVEVEAGMRRASRRTAGERWSRSPSSPDGRASRFIRGSGAGCRTRGGAAQGRRRRRGGPDRAGRRHTSGGARHPRTTTSSSTWLLPLGAGRRRDAYVRSVTWAAAPGATLLMLGMGRLRPLGSPRRTCDGGSQGGRSPGRSDPEGSVLEAVPDR